MATSRLASNVEQWWLTWRPGSTDGSAQAFAGTVADLAVGDFLMGSRHEVAAKSGTTTVTLTLKRLGVTTTVSYPSATAIQFLRPL